MPRPNQPAAAPDPPPASDEDALLEVENEEVDRGGTEAEPPEGCPITELLTEDAAAPVSTHGFAFTSRQLIAAGSALLLAVGATVGGGAWFYQARIAPRLTALETKPPAPTPPAPKVDLSPLQHQWHQAEERIGQLQKQIDAGHAALEQSQARVQELSTRLAEMVQKQSSWLRPSAGQADAKSSGDGMPAALPAMTPAVSELVLLKERNRLAGYADQAIATGNRDALQAIVDAMLDPAMKQLHSAAQAEFKRVQSYYNFSVSIDPSYTLPVREMFKGPTIKSERDLTPAQLTKILLDHKLPWEARLRSAFLLRSSTEADTDRVLLRALKEDPSLDVAKEAQTTFEKRVGQRFRLFDIPSIEAWWQMQGNLLLAPPAAAAAKKKP